MRSELARKFLAYIISHKRYIILPAGVFATLKALSLRAFSAALKAAKRCIAPMKALPYKAEKRLTCVKGGGLRSKTEGLSQKQKFMEKQYLSAEASVCGYNA